MPRRDGEKKGLIGGLIGLAGTGVGLAAELKKNKAADKEAAASSSAAGQDTHAGQGRRASSQQPQEASKFKSTLEEYKGSQSGHRGDDEALAAQTSSLRLPNDPSSGRRSPSPGRISPSPGRISPSPSRQQQRGYEQTPSGGYQSQQGYGQATAASYQSQQHGYDQTPAASYQSQQGYGQAPAASYQSQQGYGQAPPASYQSQQGYGQAPPASYQSQQPYGHAPAGDFRSSDAYPPPDGPPAYDAVAGDYKRGHQGYPDEKKSDRDYRAPGPHPSEQYAQQQQPEEMSSYGEVGPVQNRHPEQGMAPGPLELPVVVPQRRPKAKDRGWQLCYAPMLQNAGISQADFIEFLTLFNKKSTTSPLLDAVNLAAFGVGFAPGLAPMIVSMVVPTAVQAAKVAQHSYQTKSFLGKANEAFFMPRGLIAVVMTFDPDAANSTVVKVDMSKPGETFKTYGKQLVNSRLDKRLGGRFSQSSSSQQQDPNEGYSTNNDAPEAFGLPPSAPLIFPVDPLEGSTNKFKKFTNTTADYMDRRAQAKLQAENPDSGMPGQELSFKSKYGDPRGSSGQLGAGGIRGLVAGAAGAAGGRRSEGGGGGGREGGLLSSVAGRRDRSRSRRRSSSSSEDSHHSHDSDHDRDDQDRDGGRRGGGGKGGLLGGAKQWMQQKTLYLLIANVPPEA